MDATFDMKIEPKKNDEESEIKSGKRTSMVNMNCLIANGADDPLGTSGQDLATPNMSINTAVTQEFECSKIEQELSFEEEVYKELEIENNSNFQPKIELKIEPPTPTDKKFEIESEIRIEQNPIKVNEVETVSKVDPKIEPKIEEKIDPKVEPKIESKIESKIEDMVEVKIDRKVEPFEPKAEPIFDPKADPKIETTTEPKVEPKIDLKVEPNIEPRFDPEAECKIEPKFDFDPKTKTEPKGEPIKTSKSQINGQTDPQSSLETPNFNFSTFDHSTISNTIIQTTPVQIAKESIPTNHSPILGQKDFITIQNSNDSGCLSAELNPLDSKFRSSFRLLVGNSIDEN